MKEDFVVQEFAQILRKYMKKFSLEAVDIAYLAGSVKRTVTAILDHKGSLQIETAEAIAHAFGLRYFEFCNPDFPIPSLSKLPETTRKRIAFRKEKGGYKEITYEGREINEQITDVLEKYEVGDEFLAENIATEIRNRYNAHYSVTEIINRFRNSFQKSVVKTEKKDTSKVGRGPKPNFYRLIDK